MVSIPRLVALAAALASSPVAAGCGSEPLDVAPGVDLGRFQGKWYEIARLPRATQTDCYGTTAFYSQGSDGALQLVHQCNVGSSDGPLNTVAMTATVPDRSTPAKLALDVGGYSGDYWILEVGPKYEYAVVGHPSRLYYWLLSRTPALDAATTQAVVARAQAAHFDTSQLRYTPQPPAGERVSAPGPVGPVPPAVSTGCSVAVASPAASDAEGAAGHGWLAAAAVGLAGLCARRRSRLASGTRLLGI